MTIARGDLVQVIGACACGYTKYLGHVFTVYSIEEGDSACNGCRRGYGILKVARRAGIGGYYPMQWLKKLDADLTPEHVEHREEITA